MLAHTNKPTEKPAVVATAQRLGKPLDNTGEATAGLAQFMLQRQSNQTGLPDNLKSGMENLSGYNLDHVRVHRNSVKPAAVQAHAYAQGADIHLAGGQERHLPHELGHVVQQMQGRVQPTMSVGGMAVNDNAGLEREATRMGQVALQRVSVGDDYRSFLGNAALTPVVQRAGFVANTSPSEATPLSVITAKTGVNAGDVNLPYIIGIASNEEKAVSITADIDSTSVSDAERKDKKSALSKITGMARDEEFILLGADLQKFYDAGHLIGDQLLKGLGEQYSFEPKNLAPQASNFNAPVYSNVMENPIKQNAENGKTIHMKVDLEYPDPYKVPFSTIIDRGIVEESSRDNENGTVDVKGGNKNIKLTDELTFPRRIPKRWKMSAKETTGKTLSEIRKRKDDKSVKGFEYDKSQIGEGISLSKPYGFSVEGVKLNTSTILAPESDGDDIKFQEVQERIIEARQWTPPTDDQITKEELAGALKSYFPSIDSDEQLNEFFGIVKQEQFNLIAQLTKGLIIVMSKITGVNVRFNDFDMFRHRILVEMISAQKAFNSSDSNQLTIHLSNAKIALDEFRELAGTLVEEAEKLKKQIAEKISGLEVENDKINQAIPPELFRQFEPEFSHDLFVRHGNVTPLILQASRLVNNDLQGAIGKYNEAEQALIGILSDIEKEKQRIALENKLKSESQRGKRGKRDRDTDTGHTLPHPF